MGASPPSFQLPQETCWLSLAALKCLLVIRVFDAHNDWIRSNVGPNTDFHSPSVLWPLLHVDPSFKFLAPPMYIWSILRHFSKKTIETHWFKHLTFQHGTFVLNVSTFLCVCIGACCDCAVRSLAVRREKRKKTRRRRQQCSRALKWCIPQIWWWAWACPLPQKWWWWVVRHRRSCLPWCLRHPTSHVLCTTLQLLFMDKIGGSGGNCSP